MNRKEDIMKYLNEHVKQLIDTLETSVSPYHTVAEGKRQLESAGFRLLNQSSKWDLERGKGYFLTPFGSSLIGFYIGEDFQAKDMLRVEAAHTDWPCFKIKSMPEKNSNGYLTLNVETYGGPILNTWLDRPLSIAGRVSTRASDMFAPNMHLVNFDRSLLTIPNLAIHMNREVNKGIELNKQVDMLPLAGLLTENLNKDNWFMDLLANELEVGKEDILDYELYIYNRDSAEIIGVGEDMLLAPRIDNITSVQACLSALINGKRKNGINIIALFDNEEVGSMTKQGGDSSLLPMILEKLYLSLGCTREDYLSAISGGMMLSVDVAHAIHPNHPEKADITNQITLNDGVALKLSGNQKYATDSEAIGILIQLCQAYNISYKKFANRSDILGGSTLGSLTSSILPMKTVDLGVAILAMHSSRELMGVNDQVSLCSLLKAFFEENK